MTQAGGFEVGSDYVAARVSFDIDSTGVSSLKELSESLNNFRTATEAANRTGGDFLKFLQQMTALTNQANEAQTQLVNTLSRMTDTQQAIMTGQGTQISRGYPQGRVDPLSGMGGGAGTGANRTPTVADADAVLGNMAAQNPRQYFNMQSNWGNVRTGDIPANSPSDNDLAQHAQRHHARDKAQTDQAVASQMTDPFSPMQRRISGVTSGAAQLLGEMSPGGNNFGLAGMAQQGMMSLSGMLRGSAAASGGVADPSAPMSPASQGMLGGLIAGGKNFLGTGAGMAATGIAAGVGAGMLYQQGGEFIQNYRSMGQIRGGGFGEGVGYEMAIRSMALNPFITTEQARQIVSAGLSSGYTGKEFDTVTQFMANNLKDMNMSVADSMKLFKKNVVEGGQTQEGLANSLEALKVGSKTGYASLPQLQANFADTSQALIDAGVPGQAAARTAGGIAFTFNNIADLADKMPQLAQSALSPGSPLQGYMLNPTVSGIQVPPGSSPQEAFEAMPEGKQGEAVYNVMRFWAQHFWRSMPKGKAVDAYTMWLQAHFPEMRWTRPVVGKLMTELINNPNAVKQGQAKYDQAQKEAAMPKPRTTGQKIGGYITGQVGEIGALIKDLKGNLLDRPAGESWRWENLDRAMDISDYAMNDERSATLENLISQYGGKGIQVQSGNGWKELDPSNEEQIKGITSGKLKIRRKDDTSAGVTLPQIADGGKSGLTTTGGGGANAFSVAPVSGTINIKVDRDGRIVSIPEKVEVSSTNQGANAGVGDYAANRPRPGESGFRP